MWEERADHARREITALASSGLGLSELHAEAIRVIGRDVSTELTCWATLDPETLVISAMASGDARIPSHFEPFLADAEYSPGEPHSFATMARRHQSLARMSELPRQQHELSGRYRNVWKPLGLTQELRVLFLSDGACWGAGGLVRAGADFTDREVDYLRGVAPAVAQATRLAVRTELSDRHVMSPPAIAVLGADGSIRSATEGARLWQARLDDIAPNRFLVMMRILALGAHAAASGAFRVRVRDATGQWALMQASRLRGGDGADEVAVSIDAASGEQLTSMLLIAYGLSPRERDVCRDVIAGLSTAEIATHLFVTTNTVQDHLKSVFAKVDVRSRGELVARLQPQPAVSE